MVIKITTTTIASSSTTTVTPTAMPISIVDVHLALVEVMDESARTIRSLACQVECEMLSIYHLLNPDSNPHSDVD